MLDWTRGYLERHGDEHPRLSAEWLLSAVTGLSRVDLYARFDRPMTPEELSLMRDAVKRRGRGEPLQYVTGEMSFRHIVLRCERGVLIPRPETEILVDAALEGVDAALAAGNAYDDVRVRSEERIGAERAAAKARVEEMRVALDKSADENGFFDEHGVDELLCAIQGLERLQEAAPLGVRVLDLCTGTGCIALSMAGERPGTHVVATDLSPKAVGLARRNRDALGLHDAVDVLECDLATAVEPELMGTFGVLVSNPPYVPTAVLPTLPEEVVGFEPSLALDGGADGLDLFRRILDLAPVALAPGGMLAVELFEENVHDAADLCREQGGWAYVEVREDLTHRPRVLVAVREG